ncbi:MAG: hypothetical protein ACKPJJ_03755, partial [Planctomycetaceae bacterium]
YFVLFAFTFTFTFTFTYTWLVTGKREVKRGRGKVASAGPWMVGAVQARCYAESGGTVRWSAMGVTHVEE